MRSLFRPVVDFVSYRVFFFTGFPWTRGKPRRAVDGIRGKRKSPGAKKKQKKKGKKRRNRKEKRKGAIGVGSDYLATFWRQKRCTAGNTSTNVPKDTPRYSFKAHTNQQTTNKPRFHTAPLCKTS